MQAGRPENGVWIPGNSKRLFSFFQNIEEVPGPTQPFIQWAPAGHYQKVKRPGRGSDYYSPPSAEVNSEWSYSLPPLYTSLLWKRKPSPLTTRWFKYDRDDLCVTKSQFVPVIFEPPCIITSVQASKSGRMGKILSSRWNETTLVASTCVDLSY
jgi:hypothetical protein